MSSSSKSIRLSLWLMADSKDSVQSGLQSMITSLSSKHPDASSSASFEPHITLASFNLNVNSDDESSLESNPQVQELYSNLDKLVSEYLTRREASSQAPHAIFERLATHPTNPWMTVFALLRKCPELLLLRQLAYDRLVFSAEQATASPSTSCFPYVPHLSLNYDTSKQLSAIEREDLLQGVIASFNQDKKGRDCLLDVHYPLQHIAVLWNRGINYAQEWKIIKRVTIPQSSLTTPSPLSMDAFPALSTKVAIPTFDLVNYVKTYSNEQHEQFMHVAIICSQRAIEKGNHPFGGILVRDGQVVYLGENSVCQPNYQDVTRHAELVLCSHASLTFTKEQLSQSILYTSTQPCAMCVGALHWTGIKAVVYSTTQQTLERIVVRAYLTVNDPQALSTFEASTPEEDDSHNIPKSLAPKFILGPVLEEESAKVHQGFWTKHFEHEKEIDKTVFKNKW